MEIKNIDKFFQFQEQQETHWFIQYFQEDQYGKSLVFEIDRYEFEDEKVIQQLDKLINKLEKLKNMNTNDLFLPIKRIECVKDEEFGIDKIFIYCEAPYCKTLSKYFQAYS